MSVVISSLLKIQKNGLRWALKRLLNKYSLSFYFFLHKVCSFFSLSKTLGVFYDCDFCPATFDAVWFFMASEMQRRKQKCQDIAIVFCPKISSPIENYGMAFDDEGNKWRFDQIVLPLASLFPNISSYSIQSSKGSALWRLLFTKAFFPKNIAFEEMMRQTMKDLTVAQEPWGIRVSPAATRYVKNWIQSHCEGKKLIVITLRYSHLSLRRNSKIEEWAQFAHSLDRSKYHVVFVGDTDTVLHVCHEKLREFEFFNAASWNLGMRSALYQEAYLNLMNAIGPLTLCVLNQKCRVLIFKMIVKEESTASEELVNRLGYVTDKNPDWTTPFQRYIWEDDDYHVIKKEFEWMCKKIDESL